MGCQRCNSDRILNASAKSSDMNFITIGQHDHDGYVPKGLEIGGGDYIEIFMCLDCGQHQGTFPVPKHEIETNEKD